MLISCLPRAGPTFGNSPVQYGDSYSMGFKSGKKMYFNDFSWSVYLEKEFTVVSDATNQRSRAINFRRF